MNKYECSAVWSRLVSKAVIVEHEHADKSEANPLPAQFSPSQELLTDSWTELILLHWCDFFCPSFCCSAFTLVCSHEVPGRSCSLYQTLPEADLHRTPFLLLQACVTPLPLTNIRSSSIVKRATVKPGFPRKGPLRPPGRSPSHHTAAIRHYMTTADLWSS